MKDNKAVNIEEKPAETVLGTEVSRNAEGSGAFDNLRGGADAIIKGIQKNAEATADSIIADAKSEQESALKKAREELEHKLNEQIKKAEQEAALVFERSLMLAKLDSGKVVLSAKQKVISDVYNAAKEKLSNMTDQIYREFIAGFIMSYAEDNDRVVICRKDVVRLHHDWLGGVAAKKNISLSFDSEYHNETGGIILRNGTCDKNFTFSALIKDARLNTESEVINSLFGK